MKDKKLARLGSEQRIERRGLDRAPLTASQERLWFLDQLELGSPRFNVLSAIRFKGRLAPDALAGSLAEIVRRHEILRTTFEVGADGPEQVIAPRLVPALPLIDLTAIPRARHQAYLKRFLTAESQRPFDLARGPLVRWFLLIVDPDDHVLGLAMHQIISDRWSRGILVEEMVALYGAAIEGRPSPLPEPAIQYADFACWQRRGPTREEWKAQLAYWRRQLREAPTLEWPGDRPRPPMSSYRGAMIFTVIPRPILDRLKAFSQQREVTLFMTLLAALVALAHRYTGADDMVLGTPIAQRGDRQVERVMGFFLNMLALRCRVTAQQSFAELAAEAGRVALEAFSHQDVPFEKMVAAVVEGRDLSRHPLFQTAIVLQNTPLPPMELPGLEVSLVGVDWGTTAYDLSFFFWETALWEGLEEGLSVILSYSTDLFDAATVHRLKGHLQALLDQAMTAPGARLDELALLGRPERHQLLREWSTAAAPGLGRAGAGEEPAALTRLFEARAAVRGASVAVACGRERLTWSELDRGANRLAHDLRSLGIGPETPVAVCLPPGLDKIVSFLAVLKAGGFYVPLDPSLPPRRSASLVRDVGAEIVITLEAISSPAGVRRLCLDDPRQRISSGSVGSPAPHPEPDHLACVLYTSGSSGRPKGVAVSHRAVVDLVRNAPALAPGQAMGQLAETSFDASTFEIWAPLLAGARLVIVDAPDKTLDAESFRSLRRRQGIDALLLTTPHFHHLAQQDPGSFDDLRCLIFGGESPRPDGVRAVRAGCPETELWHAYGPTEATTFATLRRIGCEGDGGKPSAAPVPIGRPLPGARLHLLDRRGRAVPVGVSGEIWLGGDGLARGYVGRPRETARAFVPDAFTDGPGLRLYRTGDRGRHTAAGEVVFRGRIDGQLKLRGYRIEPEEIETLLLEDPEVDRAAVTAAVPPGGTSPSLVAHVRLLPAAARDPVRKAQELRAFLRSRLPAYMTPAAVAFADELPLTASGKVDRAALERRGFAAGVVRSPFVAPRNALEQEIADLFHRVLGHREVGIYDDFFGLGGHSMNAVEVVSDLRRSQGLALDVRVLFERPTVVGLSRLIESLRATEPR